MHPATGGHDSLTNSRGSYIERLAPSEEGNGIGVAPVGVVDRPSISPLAPEAAPTEDNRGRRNETKNRVHAAGFQAQDLGKARVGQAKTARGAIHRLPAACNSRM